LFDSRRLGTTLATVRRRRSLALVQAVPECDQLGA